MIPLMFLLGQMDSGSVTPPGVLPTPNCNIPLPDIKNSSGNVVNIGDFWNEQGGYYSGLFTLTGNEVYALIISPKNIGHIYGKKHATLNNSSTRMILSLMISRFNGKKNTEDVINYIITNNQQSTYPLWSDIINIRNGSLGGFNDWYLPSSEEVVLMLKYFFPDNSNCNYNCNYASSYFFGDNVFPCRYYQRPSSYSITVFNSFMTNGSESFKNFIGSGHYLATSSRCAIDIDSPQYFAFNYNNTYYNYWTPNAYPINFPTVMESRLVRRVLVS